MKQTNYLTFNIYETDFMKLDEVVQNATVIYFNNFGKLYVPP